MEETRNPILVGESGASVTHVQRADGSSSVEKCADRAAIGMEAAIMNWCVPRLPVPRVIHHEPGFLSMTLLPGVTLDKVSPQIAVRVLVEALNRIHSIPVEECPFSAAWTLRVNQAEERFLAGLVDPTDFDQENFGRESAVMIAELKSFPPLPDVVSFTHGDACLENFLTVDGRLSGILDWGRAGVTHPAQDWALALRSVASQFGPEGERMLREDVPAHSASPVLQRRLRLLDEFF
jgi:aminoglycoside phosphotransferase